MPRIHPREFLRSAALNNALPKLLPICRDLASARNELRWLQNHAIELARQTGNRHHGLILHDFVQRRAHGEPLQYILGSEFWGDLEIICRPGVLIPRPETAAAVTYLVSLLRGSRKSTSLVLPLRVLDLCTGSGCIPLLFQYEYYKHGRTEGSLEIIGVDLSSEALSLARQNLIHQIASQGKKCHEPVQALRSLQGIGFVQADILDEGKPCSVIEVLRRLKTGSGVVSFDILISNPPYVSPKDFRTIPRSVRKFEPKLALVPPHYTGANNNVTADAFYPKLLSIAEQVRAKVALFEISDMEQANRVISMAKKYRRWSGMEIWRDDPTARDEDTNGMVIDEQQVKVRGSGQGRSVMLYTDEGRALLALPPPSAAENLRLS